MSETPDAAAGAKLAKTAAKRRLERALRANLARRKLQARALRDAGSHDKNVTAAGQSPIGTADDV
ncbi:MAG: hypothetical protein KGQ37_02330 [Hyphomicrobiales bacterium]|nr:hypothetical protein [Hyphomicrobiales bacterium]